jgi:hypothetical protein
MKHLLLCLLVFSLLPCSVQADLYRWQDQNGVVHFSDTPPPEKQAGTLEVMAEAESSPISGGAFGENTPLQNDDNVLYSLRSKPLTAEQKLSIDACLKRHNVHQGLWFYHVERNDYDDNRWFLHVSIYFKPEKTQGRVRSGKMLFLETLHGEAEPQGNWPGRSGILNYYQAARPNGSFSSLASPPDIKDIPFSKEDASIPDAYIVEIIDTIRAIPRFKTHPIVDFFTKNADHTILSCCFYSKCITLKKGAGGKWEIIDETSRYRLPDTM